MLDAAIEVTAAQHASEQKFLQSEEKLLNENGGKMMGQLQSISALMSEMLLHTASTAASECIQPAVLPPNTTIA